MALLRGHSSWSTVCLVLALTLLALFWPATGSAQSPSEYQAKVAFLYNTPKFVDWPPEAMTAPTFTIGILGDDPLGPLLEQLASRTIKGKKIVIRRLLSLDRASDCQLLFVAASEQRRLTAVLARLRELPVLTVSDIDGFAYAGGILEVALRRDHLTFIVNNHQAKRQGLKISAQMLKLAREIME